MYRHLSMGHYKAFLCVCMKDDVDSFPIRAALTVVPAAVQLAGLY